MELLKTMNKLKTLLVSLIIGLAIGIVVFAFNNPPGNPPTGGGALGVGSNAPASSLYIASSTGYVGIGTTNPGIYKLDVVGGKFRAASNVYDSGWFAVTPYTAYTKTHNLGTTKVLIQVFFSSVSDGSSNVIALNWASRDWTANGDRQLGVCIRDVTTTQITVNAGQNVADKYVGSVLTGYASGYYRIIMLALE
jgi:hypothetical protein